MRNLVLGWCDYTWEKSRAFVKSLRATGYDGDIVFINGARSSETNKKYREYKVEIAPLCVEASPTGIGRQASYFQFLCNHQNEYDGVFISDVRDVFFQSNPFNHYNDDNLHFVCEDLKIKDQYLNKLWVSVNFGQNVLDLIGGETIICAGNFYGRMGVMLDCTNKMRSRGTNNEQSTLNYLFRVGEIKGVADPNDGHHVVWTIGTKIDTEHDDFYNMFGHNLYTLDDYLPPVVHQYDRHPRIWKAVQGYYAD